MRPYDYFLAEKEHCERLLINAGYREDEASKIAINAALDAAEKKIGKVIRGDMMEVVT